MRRARLVIASCIAVVAALVFAGSALALVDLAPVAAADVAVENGADLSSSARAQLAAPRCRVAEALSAPATLSDRQTAGVRVPRLTRFARTGAGWPPVGRGRAGRDGEKAEPRRREP